MFKISVLWTGEGELWCQSYHLLKSFLQLKKICIFKDKFVWSPITHLPVSYSVYSPVSAAARMPWVGRSFQFVVFSLTVSCLDTAYGLRINYNPQVCFKLTEKLLWMFSYTANNKAWRKLYSLSLKLQYEAQTQHCFTLWRG